MNIPFDIFPLWYKSSLNLGGTVLAEKEVRSYTFTYFVYLLPFLRCLEFWVGCSIGCFFLRLRERERLPKGNIRNLLLVTCVLLMYLAHQVNNLTVGVVIYPVYTPGFTLLIFTLASGKTFASSLLSHKLIVKLGKSSYALYISHYAGMAIYQNLASIGIVFPQGIYFIVLGLCLAISLVIYDFVEVPGQQWLIKISKARN